MSGCRGAQTGQAEHRRFGNHPGPEQPEGFGAYWWAWSPKARRGVDAAAIAGRQNKGKRVRAWNAQPDIGGRDAVAEALAQEIQNAGGEAYTLKADVRDDAQIQGMFDSIANEHGGNHS